LRHVLIGAGTRDTWFTEEKWRRDVAWLQGAGVAHEVVTFDGGHEWTGPFRDAARLNR
jgi:predicted esterase